MFQVKKPKVVKLSVAPTYYKLPSGKVIDNDEFDKMQSQGQIEPGHYPFKLDGINDDFGGVFTIVPSKPQNAQDALRQEQAMAELVQKIIDENLEPKQIEPLIKDKPFLKWFIIINTIINNTEEDAKKVVPKLAAAGAEFSFFLRADSPNHLELTKKAIPILGDVINKLPPLRILKFLSSLLRASDATITLDCKLFSLIHEYGIIQTLDPLYNGTILHRSLANELDNTPLLIGSLHLANINFPFHHKDKEGKTPLMIAVKTGKDKVVKLLLKLLSEGIDIGLNEPDNNGRTPVMIAAALGFHNIVTMLLEAHANITMRDKNGKTILNYWAMDASSMSKIFQEICINPERHHAAKLNWLYNANRQGLYLATLADGQSERILIAKKGKAGIILEQVVAKVAQGDPRYSDVLGQIIPVLQSTDDRSLLEVCLANKNKCGELIKQQLTTLFFTACAIGDLGTITDLTLSLGVDPAATDKLGRTALHYAVMRSELVIQTAAKQGQKVDLLFCRQNKPAVLKFLLQLGIEDKPNSQGNTAFGLLERDSKASIDWDRVNAIALMQAWLEQQSEQPVTITSKPSAKTFK